MLPRVLHSVMPLCDDLFMSTEHTILATRHNREAELFERAIKAAKSLSKGNIPEDELEAFVVDHFSGIRRRSLRAIEQHSWLNWVNNLDAYGRNAIDFLRLEKERPGYQRVRILFGLYADGAQCFVASEMPQIVRTMTSQFDEAITQLQGLGIDKPNLRLEFQGVMASPPQDQPWKRVKTLEAAQAFELNFLGRISDAYIGLIRCIRHMNEAEMAKAWLAYKVHQAKQGTQNSDRAESLRTLKKEGARCFAELKVMTDYFAMNAQTLSNYGDVMKRHADTAESSPSEAARHHLRLI